MGRSSLKVTNPTPLPCDGVLLHYLSTGRGTDEAFLEEAGQEQELVRNAVQVLRSAANKSTVVSSDADPLDCTAATRVLVTLMRSSSIQEQLRILQSLKRDLRQQQAASTSATSPQPAPSSVLLYIFLEWSFSSPTPVPMRRILQQVIGVMAPLVSRTLVFDSIAGIVRSLDHQPDVWINPVETLKEVLQCTTSLQVIQQDPNLQLAIWDTLWRQAEVVQDVLVQCNNGNRSDDSVDVVMWDTEIVDAVKSGTSIAHLCVTTLQASLDNKIGLPQHVHPIVSKLRQFLWLLLQCPAIPLEDLIALGLACSRLEITAAVSNFGASQTSDLLDKARKELPIVPTAALAHGVAASLSSDVLFGFSGSVSSNQPTPCVAYELLRLFSDMSEHADLEVRYLALRGIRAVVRRCNTVISTTSPSVLGPVITDELASQLVALSFDVVMAAWERPSSRKVETAIPPVFREVIALRRRQSDSLDELVQRLLAQPSHRKGRYLALEVLLPDTSTQSLFSLELGRDLLSGISDSGHNAGAIADLWAALLQQLFKEMLLEAGCPTTLKESTGRHPKDPECSNATPPPTQLDLETVLESWFRLWIPSLVDALLSPEYSRRKQVAAFCLPRIVTALGGPTFRPEAAMAFRLVLSECHSRYHGGMPSSLESVILWAELQTVSIAEAEGLLDQKCHGEKAIHLQQLISRQLSKDRLCGALVHVSPTIRTVAYEALGACARSSFLDCRKEMLEYELDLWRFSLPLAQKYGGKEYATTILHRMVSLLERLLQYDVTHTAWTNSDDEKGFLLPFTSYLLRKVVLQQGAYSGTTFDKETFSLRLLESIFVFASRNQALAYSSNLIPTNGRILQRRCKEQEEILLDKVRTRLMDADVLRALQLLLHSIWDGTRSSSYLLVNSFISLDRIDVASQGLGPCWESSPLQSEARYVYLASSPRQREADTGSRLLALLCLSSPPPTRLAMLRRIVDLMERRIESMQSMLQSILRGTSRVEDGSNLPLAHGIVHALRLILESTDQDSCPDLIRVASILCRGLRLSLRVVAGTNCDTLMIDPESVDVLCHKNAINPGAIGANGIVASVLRASNEEQKLCMASQRLVVGTWLLTKETCKSLAHIFSMKSMHASSDLIDEAGKLLLSTLTSLKHAGAAFGSHKALQQISERCLTHADMSLRRLPSEWLTRLICEISGSERIVRNSILRRSTGYALGFLSIMRSEVLTRLPPRQLCRHVIKRLLRLSLPPKRSFEEILSSIGFKRDRLRSTFEILAQDSTIELVDDCSYDVNARIHALNILRAVILDAPLVGEVFPWAGDALASSMLGYLDSHWPIQNSATLVLSSVMLRVVDADKNASNANSTCSKAVSIAELFRSYPRFAPFLRCFLEAAVAGAIQGPSSHALPPVYPVLLLLARVQPVSYAERETEHVVAPTWPSVVASFGHECLVVRRAASKAISNLCVETKLSVHSSWRLMEACIEEIRFGCSWNRVHGILMAFDRILMSRSDSKLPSSVVQSLAELLERILQVKNSPKLPSPPLCMTISLELLHRIDPGRFDRACEHLLPVLESNVAQTFGLVELCVALGSLATKRICDKLWNSNGHVNTCSSCLAQLSVLLQSESCDVRHAAVKAFKKRLAPGLCKVQHGMDELTCKDAVCLVSLILETALENEIKRNQWDPLGSHPPTLRRLSRCLIEVLRILVRFESDAFDEKRQLCTLQSALSLLPLGLTVDSTCESSQTGNALELLALVLRRQPQIEPAMLEQFVRTVDALSKPDSEWRLRYSAASSLRDSGILRRAGIPLESMRVLVLCVLRLAQDSDEDVRLLGSDLVHDLVPEHKVPVPGARFAMSEFVICAASHAGALSIVALDVACEYSKGVEDLIDAFFREWDTFRVSDGMDLDSLVNSNPDRRIFEVEDPNSYSEPCLMVQAAVVSWRKQTSQALDLYEQHLTKRLLRRSYDVLQLLLTRASNCKGCTQQGYDVTSEPKVMPLLHNLLLGCAAVMERQSCSSENDLNIIGAAQDLLRASSPINGSIRKVLLLLGQSTKHDNDAFLDACFLIADTSFSIGTSVVRDALISLSE